MQPARPLTLLLFTIILNHCNGHLGNKLENQRIRVDAVHLPPLMIIARNSNGTARYSGALYEQLQWLSHHLQFKYDLYQEPNNRIGIQSANGSWNGLIGQLIRRETDLALFPFTISYQRQQVMEFTGAFAGGHNVLLTRYPTEQFSTEAVSKPFSTQVWIGWIVAFVVVSISSTLFVYARFQLNNVNKARRLKTIDGMLFYIIGTITAQGGYFRAGHHFLGILAISWCLAAFVFVNVYSTVLTSALATSYVAPEINSMEDLAESSYFKMALIQGSTAEEDVLAATSGPMRIIKGKLLQCPQCSSPFVEEMGRKVMNENYVAFQHSSAAMGLIQSTFRAAKKKCQLTLAHEKFQWMHSFLAAPKSSPYIEEINQESLWAHAFGLPRKWGSFDPDNHPCLLKFNRRGFEVHSQNRPLKLLQLYPAFYILPVGFLLAAICFVYEHVSSVTFVCLKSLRN